VSGARPDDVLHLVVGPEEHGVVRHGILVAQACEQPIHRMADLARLPDLAGVRVVHVPFTDRLFGATAEASAAAFSELGAAVTDAGAALSVTLHDLPAGRSALQARRRATYEQVVAQARGIVVNSMRELELLGELRHQARSVRMIPLPVERSPDARPGDRQAGDPSAQVVVLGFIFPDRGYEAVIAELPDGAGLLALGRPSDGHEDLPDRLIAQALAAGHELTVTGFVPDDDLPAALRAAAVPVAPNRNVAASGSIATWIGQRRRPLVPDSSYTRELDARAPGTVLRYDADEPGALRAAIEHALREPKSTWIAADTDLGPGLAETATAYRRHFAGCLPPAPIRVGADRWTVPENRWDLLDDHRPASPPTVSMIVPYYQAQQQLDLVLAGLAAQTHPHDRLQIVVADDGSEHAPDVSAAGDLAVTVVRQADRGFRAAAARNLGARAASGEVLLFLDGDTVPEPDYVARLSRLPAIAPDALVVGHRRHADLTGWTPSGSPRVLPEPAWLADGYRDSRDLLDADSRSYRYVISAVCGLHRDLFAELGGFSEEFAAYGGEDWELAHRAWVAGALLAHVPGAVAWHDGPDWAGRRAAEGDEADGGESSKNAETELLTRLLPDPIARGGGQWFPYPAIVVVLPDRGVAATLATSRWAFRGDTDCGLWLVGPTAEQTIRALGDPRIRLGPVAADVLARASVVVELTDPARLDGLAELADLAGRQGRLSTPAGVINPARALARARRWAAATDQDEAELAALLFGGRDLLRPRPLADVDLAHELKYVGQPAAGQSGAGPSISRS
jgi:GT2 family glycosyltransferase